MSSWLRIIFSVCLLLLLFLGFLHPTKELSLDLGQHLLRGKIMVDTYSIITTNLFSYTYPNFSYISNEWLSEVIFYFINSVFGLNFLILFTSVIVTVSFALVYLSAKKNANVIIVSFAALGYLFILFERSYIRPEIFSYLFLSLFIFLLYRFRETYSRWIFLLIPLQVLWVNMHIYFIVGIVVTGLFLLEGLIVFRKRKDYIKTLLIIFVSLFIVSCINPYGIKGLLFPISFSQNYGFSVQENFGLFTVENVNAGKIIYSFLFFKVAAFVLFLSLIFTISKSRVIDWLLALVFIFAPIVAVRNLPLFVFATFIPFAYVLTTLFTQYISFTKHYSSRIINGVFLVIFIVLVTWCIKVLNDAQSIGFGSDKRGEAAVNFLVDNKIKGSILNDYDFGSYLSYRLYPERVFIDGRPEAYPAEFFQQIYRPMFKNSSIFKRIDNIYHFNVIFFSISDESSGAKQFINTILADNAWRLVYLDQYAIIFVKNSVENKNVIQKYTITENTYRLPVSLSTKDLDNLGYFFGEIGWSNKSFEAYEKIYNSDNNNCTALHNILFILNQKQEDSSIYVAKYQMFCNN